MMEANAVLYNGGLVNMKKKQKKNVTTFYISDVIQSL